MSMIYKGVGVTWGTSSTTFSTGMGTFYLQSRDHSKKAENKSIKDGNGETRGKVFFDQTEEASFEYIPISSGTVNGSLVPTIPAIGDLFTVSDSIYTAIAGVYLVEDISTKSSNNGALKATVKLMKYPYITS